jgi:hypothetical protein
MHWPVMRGASVQIGVPASSSWPSGVIDRLTCRKVHPVSLWVLLLFVLQNVLALVVLRSVVWHRLATVVFF